MAELKLAIPSKGRLEQQSRLFFAEAGLPITRPGGARSYQGDMDAQPEISVRFLSAGEIARELIRGNLDIGITGADLIHEATENGENNVTFVKKLDFGQADVVVAVPDVWIDAVHMRDLSDVAADFFVQRGRWLKVATKYVNLTRRYFAAHGIAEYRVVESLGATEAATASGSADLIVDITSTGSTLKANGLRVLTDGIILKSQANLVISRNANFNARQQILLEQMLLSLGSTL